MKGDAYVGYRRENPKNTTKIIHDVIWQSRKMGSTCDSPIRRRWKNRLYNTVLEDEKQNVFHEFRKVMSWNSKKMFVCSIVEIKNTKQKTVKGGNSRRISSFFTFYISTEKDYQYVSRCISILWD